MRGKYHRYKEKWSMCKSPIISMYLKSKSHEGKVHNTMAIQMESIEDQGEQYRAKGRQGRKKMQRPCQAVRRAQDHPHWEGPKRDSETIALRLNDKQIRA